MSTYQPAVDEAISTRTCGVCGGAGVIHERVPRCDVQFDGYRCVLPDSPAHKYHSPALFTEGEERQLATQNAQSAAQEER